MARRHRRRSLVELYARTPLFTQAVHLLNHKVSYRKIKKFLDSKHFHASLSLLENLNKKVKYAKTHHINIYQIIDKRKGDKLTKPIHHHKKNIEDVAKQGKIVSSSGIHIPANDKASKYIKNAEHRAKSIHFLPKDDYYNTQWVLDNQINEYNRQLLTGKCDDAVRKAGLKAIDLKCKYAGGQMSLEAAKQAYVIGHAEAQAFLEYALKFVPKDHTKDYLKGAQKYETEILHHLDLSKDGHRLLLGFKKKGIHIE